MDKMHFSLKFFESTGLVADVTPKPSTYPDNFPSEYSEKTLKGFADSLFPGECVNIDLYEFAKVDVHRGTRLSTIMNRSVLPKELLELLKKSTRDYRLLERSGENRLSIQRKIADISREINESKKTIADLRIRETGGKQRPAQVNKDKPFDLLTAIVESREEHSSAREKMYLKAVLGEISPISNVESVLNSLVAALINATNAFEQEHARVARLEMQIK